MHAQDTARSLGPGKRRAATQSCCVEVVVRCTMARYRVETISRSTYLVLLMGLAGGNNPLARISRPGNESYMIVMHN